MQRYRAHGEEVFEESFDCRATGGREKQAGRLVVVTQRLERQVSPLEDTRGAQEGGPTAGGTGSTQSLGEPEPPTGKRRQPHKSQATWKLQKSAKFMGEKLLWHKETGVRRVGLEGDEHARLKQTTKRDRREHRKYNEHNYKA